MEKKIFICCSAKSTEFLIRVILKELRLKEAFKKEDADYVVVELKNPCCGFNENNLEQVDNKPTIILTTQGYDYQQKISENLKARGIEKKKLIVEIPNNYLDVVEKFKKILNEE